MLELSQVNPACWARLPPELARNNHVYVTTLAAARCDSLHHVRVHSPDGGLTLNPNSERVLLSVAKDADNHNGGQLNFGPDGFLYLVLGTAAATAILRSMAGQRILLASCCASTSTRSRAAPRHSEAARPAIHSP